MPFKKHKLTITHDPLDNILNKFFFELSTKLPSNLLYKIKLQIYRRGDKVKYIILRAYSSFLSKLIQPCNQIEYVVTTDKLGFIYTVYKIIKPQ